MKTARLSSELCPKGPHRLSSERSLNGKNQSSATRYSQVVVSTTWKNESVTLYVVARWSRLTGSREDNIVAVFNKTLQRFTATTCTLGIKYIPTSAEYTRFQTTGSDGR